MPTLVTTPATGAVRRRCWRSLSASWYSRRSRSFCACSWARRPRGTTKSSSLRAASSRLSAPRLPASLRASSARGWTIFSRSSVARSSLWSSSTVLRRCSSRVCGRSSSRIRAWPASTRRPGSTATLATTPATGRLRLSLWRGWTMPTKSAAWAPPASRSRGASKKGVRMVVVLCLSVFDAHIVGIQQAALDQLQGDLGQAQPAGGVDEAQFGLHHIGLQAQQAVLRGHAGIELLLHALQQVLAGLQLDQQLRIFLAQLVELGAAVVEVAGQGLAHRMDLQLALLQAQLLGAVLGLAALVLADRHFDGHADRPVGVAALGRLLGGLQQAVVETVAAVGGLHV